MPSEWLGVHGGRSYGPSPRGSSTPGPAVCNTVHTVVLLYRTRNLIKHAEVVLKLGELINISEKTLSYKYSLFHDFSPRSHEFPWLQGLDFMTTGLDPCQKCVEMWPK